MKKIAFLTVIAAVITLLAVSCGQNAQNQTPVEQTEEAQQEVEQTMNDAQFLALMETIYYKLPTSVMPSYMRTENQRSDMNVFEYCSGNYLIANQHHDDGCFDQWEMAAYLSEDKNNVVVIVQFGSGLDAYDMKSDKTINYNIATGELKEIERPMDPITIDELFAPSLFNNPAQVTEIKNLFKASGQPISYRDFDKDGFKICEDIPYWEYPDFYDTQNFVLSSRKWNGNRFVKSTRWKWGEHEWVPLNE